MNKHETFTNSKKYIAQSQQTMPKIVNYLRIHAP